MILPEKDRMPTSPSLVQRIHVVRTRARLAMAARGVAWLLALVGGMLVFAGFADRAIHIDHPSVAIGDPGGDPRGQCCGRVAARVGSVDSAPLEPGSRTPRSRNASPVSRSGWPAPSSFWNGNATRTSARRPCRTA